MSSYIATPSDTETEIETIGIVTPATEPETKTFDIVTPDTKPETKTTFDIAASIASLYPDGLVVAGIKFASFETLLKSAKERSQETPLSVALKAFNETSDCLKLRTLDKSRYHGWVADIADLMTFTNSAAAFINIDGWEETETQMVWQKRWRDILSDTITDVCVDSSASPLEYLRACLSGISVTFLRQKAIRAFLEFDSSDMSLDTFLKEYTTLRTDFHEFYPHIRADKMMQEILHIQFKGRVHELEPLLGAAIENLSYEEGLTKCHEHLLENEESD